MVDIDSLQLNYFINDMSIGDIVMSCYDCNTVDAIGVVTGKYEWHNEYPEYKRIDGCIL